jgi:subtilisin family serine protease
VVRSLRYSLARLALVAVLGLGGAPGAGAQEAKEPPWTAPVKTLDEALKTGRIRQETVDAARKDGVAPVLIYLRLPSPFQPEGGLTTIQVNQQREGIQAAQNAVLQQLVGSPLSGVKRYRSTPWLALTTDTDALTVLVGMPGVLRINLDRRFYPALSTSVPLVGGDRVRRAYGTAGSGWAVAILDSGVEKNHAFLTGKVVSEACYSTTSFTTNSLCPNGMNSNAAGSGVPCTINGCDHGTHVAGIAAGKGTTFHGVAADASIIAIQVFSDNDGSIEGFVSDLILGLERVYELRNAYRIAAVNLSLALPDIRFTSREECDDNTQAIKDAVDNLRGAGIATVAAAGNEAQTVIGNFVPGVAPPACISSVVSVGATAEPAGTTPELVDPFSQAAFFLDVLAPGIGINSSVPGNAFAMKDGTSQAAPHVAGAFAVLKALGPGSSRGVSTILGTLTSTGVPITDPRLGPGVMKPRVQLDAAVQAQTSMALPPSHLRLDTATWNYIRVRWTDNATNEQQYHLQWRPHSTTGAETTMPLGANVTVGAPGQSLAAMSDYDFRVRACLGVGLGTGIDCSDWTAWSTFWTLACPPTSTLPECLAP